MLFDRLSPGRSISTLAALCLAIGALTACSTGSGGGGGDGGNGSGGSANGGEAGSTVTVTPGCPSYLSEEQNGKPCAPVGQKCGGPPTICGGSSHSSFCQNDGTWVVFHWDSFCSCPDTMPTDGDACDPAMYGNCQFTVTADCGEAKVFANCAYPNGGTSAVWTVDDPVCP